MSSPGGEHERVVVKAGDPASRRAEAAALRALGRLGDPALVEPADLPVDLPIDGSGRPAVATRYVPGPTLAGLVAGAGPLDAGAAARLVAPVARAVAAIHDAGWVHGDLSPANIVVGANGPVLVDLGAAAPMATSRATGTPGFTAPEVVAGGSTSPASDVWSLAAVYAWAVGRTNVDDLTAMSLLHPHLGAAWSGVPLQRPTATELADAFTALGEAGGGAAVGLPQPAADAADRRARASARALAPTRDYGPRPTDPAARNDVAEDLDSDAGRRSRAVLLAATAASVVVVCGQLVA